MSSFKFNHNWSEIQTLLKTRFHQLADENLDLVEGKSEELLQRLRQKLSLNTEELEVLLGGLSREIQNTVKDKVSETQEKAKAAFEEVRLRVDDWKEDGRAYVRSNPRQSVLTALFAGFVTGLLFRR